MNTLFWLEPHFELASPGIMATWLAWYEQMATALSKAEPGSTTLIAALNTAPTRNRPTVPGSQLLTFSQAELRADWAIEGDVFMALEHDTLPEQRIKQLQTMLQRRLSGFRPDFVFLHNQQPWLRRLFPNAVFVNIEASWTSRPPFPMSWHLDIVGAGKGRILAEHTDALLASIVIDDGGQGWLDEICLMAGQTQQSPPAVEYIQSLRRQYQRIILLPLGLFDRYDGRTSLFAILDEYLERLDGKDLHILTQHPLRGILTPEQVTYLSSRYPWLIDGSAWGSQTLLPLVDQVIADLSTVATQALFFDKDAISIRRRLRNFPIDTSLRNPLADLLQNANTTMRRRALYWLLTCYTVPEQRLFDGRWLVDFLQRARTAQTEHRPWLTYQSVIAETSDWALACWRTPMRNTPTESAEKAASISNSPLSNDDAPPRSPILTMQISQVDPITETRRYREAEALVAAGDKTAARAILEDLAARQAIGWEIYNDLGSLRLEAGEIEGAIAALRAAVNLELTSNLALRNLAATYVAAGDIGNLLVVCQQLLRQEPDNQDFLLFLRDVVVAADMRFDDVSWLSPRMAAEQTELIRAREQLAVLERERIELQAKSRLYDELKLLRPGQRRPDETPATWDTIYALDKLAWLDALIASVKTGAYQGFPLPKFPPERLQIGIMGSSNETGLREGFRFYNLVTERCAMHSRPLTPDMRLLDFGTGWGRYPRIFMKDIRPENILGIDVDAALIEVCRDSYPDYGRFEQVPAFPPTALPADSFDLVIAYSVFSHLSEAAASAWIQEFARILKPGGMIAVTTQGRSFLDYCEDIRKTGGDPGQPWHRNLARSFVDIEACRAAYDRGEFLFAATGGGEVRPSTFYGEALVPEGHVRTVWGQWLEPLDFIDDRARLPQALIVMRKRP